MIVYHTWSIINQTLICLFMKFVLYMFVSTQDSKDSEVLQNMASGCDFGRNPKTDCWVYSVECQWSASTVRAGHKGSHKGHRRCCTQCVIRESFPPLNLLSLLIPFPLLFFSQLSLHRCFWCYWHWRSPSSKGLWCFTLGRTWTVCLWQEYC